MHLKAVAEMLLAHADAAEDTDVDEHKRRTAISHHPVRECWLAVVREVHGRAKS